jgi:hypothetical protein
MTGMPRAVIASVLALACGPSAFAHPPVLTDRFLVVLEQKADLAALDALERRLRTVHAARTIARMTEGALLGLLVSLDVARAPELEREKAVVSVVRVEAPTEASVSAAEVAFQRSPRGWAIPGLYTVVLHDRWSFGLELPPDWDDLTGMARRKAFRERREALVRKTAEQVAAQYGGAVRGSYSGETTFTCAMTEAAALRMAADERVWRVRETIYILIDHLPSRSIREPFPAPAFWRP